MEKNKKILLGGIIVTIITGAVLFCYFFGESRQPIEGVSLIPPVATSTPISEWKTFVNTKYGYSVLVPKIVEIGNRSGHYSNISNEEEPELGFYGEGGSFSIELLAPRSVSQWMGREGIFDLKSFAEAVRDTQVNNKNPFVLNKKVGELKEIQFSSLRAYEFVLNGSFAIPPNGKGGEYLLDLGIPHRYIVTENLRGHKVIIHHPINDISEKMVKTIRFIK